MSLTISAKKADGTFSYEVYNGTTMIEAGNGYPTQKDAEMSARVCYNELHRVNFIWTAEFAQNDYVSLDDVLAELEL